MLKKGASFPLQVAECRDGMFDADDIFLVWEKPDLASLAQFAANAIEVSI